MTDPVLKALFWPFERGELSFPPQTGEAAPWLFLNASAEIPFEDIAPHRLACVQPNFKLYSELERAGFSVQPTLAHFQEKWAPVFRPEMRENENLEPSRDLAKSGNAPGGRGGFAAALVRLGRDRQEARALLAAAYRAVETGGLIIAAGAKDEGAASLEREWAGLLPLEGVLPKAGCRVFWARKPSDAASALASVLAEWTASGRPAAYMREGFVTCPGIFSWQAVDEGSKFLADHLPTALSGRLADLGAGWGYLAVELLKHCPALEAIDLYENDARALDCARANLAAVPHRAQKRFFWEDVTAGLAAGAPYDWIVMNPPFHSGKATEPGLGQAFIRAAAGALAPKGRLLMVANRHLAYEATLQSCFSAVQSLAQNGRYKILLASGRLASASSPSHQRARGR